MAQNTVRIGGFGQSDRIRIKIGKANAALDFTLRVCSLHCNGRSAPFNFSPQYFDMIPKTPSRHLLLALGFLLCATIPFVHGESSTCLTVYKNGGAPAVFQSPKCPRWKLSDYDSPPQTTARCQTAMLQGRRNSQEDRALCVLDVRIPFPGTKLSLPLVCVLEVSSEAFVVIYCVRRWNRSERDQGGCGRDCGSFRWS